MQKPCPRCKQILKSMPKSRVKNVLGGNPSGGRPGPGSPKSKGFGSLISLDATKGGGASGPASTGERNTRGSMSNPVLLRCAKCRKDFEFRGGKLNEIKPHMRK